MVSSAILKIFKKVRLENYANLHFGRTGQNPTLRTTVSSDKNRHYQGHPKVAGQIALKKKPSQASRRFHCNGGNQLPAIKGRRLHLQPS